MQRLPTVLLRHDTPDGSHYDWLLADPRLAADPASPLWTVRMAWPSRAWTAAEAWDMEPIAPHRRAYLTYQGPIAPAAGTTTPRGSVVRIDRGTFVPRIWNNQRFVINLELEHFRGTVQAARLSQTLWRARLLHDPAPVSDILG